MSNIIEAKLSALPKARQIGQGWVARCPAHPDADPYSLAWAVGAEGLSIACDAGCDEKAITAAIGLSEMPRTVPQKAPRARITAAESVNPPAPGADPDHDRRTAEFAIASAQKIAAMPAAPELEDVIKYPDVRLDPDFEPAPPGWRPSIAADDVVHEPGILPPPTDPMAVAHELVQTTYTDAGELILRHWRGGWWSWARSHWVEREERAVRKQAYAFTEHATFAQGDKVRPWEPTRFKIGNLLEALAAITHLDETTNQPTWIDGRHDGGVDVVAVANGLLDLRRRVLLPHSPMFFNQTAVPFAYQPKAPPPGRWLAFLRQLWPDDDESIAALAEFFGYVVSGRLDLHKILLVVGPTRAGKGTVARILGKLIGPANVAGPTLSSLSFDFGLAPLLGKGLAVISDARLDASRDSSVVVERLLAISGEDTITVNRKYREQWTGKLPTRFLIISNELPRLGDASATIANRFVVLLLRESWLGREDHTLESALTAELTGILNWSLAGLDRLTEQDRFTRPVSTDEAILALQDLASPVAAFVRDQCVTGPTHEVMIDIIYGRWKEWAEANGNRAGSRQTFGRNIRAVVPGLRVSQARDGDNRDRLYQGIGLRTDDIDAVRVPSRAESVTEAPGTQWHALQPNVGGTPQKKTAFDPEYATDDDGEAKADA